VPTSEYPSEPDYLPKLPKLKMNLTTLPSILIVDDEAHNFDVIQSILGSQNYELQYASSGQEALESLEIMSLDLILLDVMMPDRDGIETCLLIKANPLGRSIPIIMVTALTAKVDLARCLEAGADDFISKPVSGLELRARVHSMLRIKQQYEQLQQCFQREAILEQEKRELLENQNLELEKQVKIRTASLKATAELITYNSLHDPLTNLPNRRMLLDRLNITISQARNLPVYQYAVLFLDLDRFNIINDSLGHLVGDQVLIEVAEKLKTILEEVYLISRFGGDEFVILLEYISGIEEAIKIAESILKEFQIPVIANDYEIFTNVSIGIVLGTSNYTEASDLLRDADIAMYKAKGNGRNCYQVFDTKMHNQVLNRLSLETDLYKALEYNEFEVYYQPIFDLAENRVIGFESLIRWNSPVRGFVSPVEFIPIAEETGLIVRLDNWMFCTACEQLSQWKNQYPDRFPLKLSLNLSAQDLRKVSLLTDIDLLLAKTGLEGNYLTLEITESMLIDDINKTIRLLSELKKRNIQISIDDFGTGYSSLNYLCRLPADYLKIDRSFVTQMKARNRDYQVVSSIIALSNQLGFKVVAEGIETEAQLESLKQLGCEYGQGYLFSNPLSGAEIEAQFFIRR